MNRRDFLECVGLTAGALLVPKLIKPAPKMFDMGRSICRSSRTQILFYSGFMPHFSSKPTGSLLDVRDIDADAIVPAIGSSIVLPIRDTSPLYGIPGYARVIHDGKDFCQINRFDLFGYCDPPAGSKVSLSALRISML